MPSLYKLYPGICPTTEGKAWKNLNQGRKPQYGARRPLEAITGHPVHWRSQYESPIIVVITVQTTITLLVCDTWKVWHPFSITKLYLILYPTSVIQSYWISVKYIHLTFPRPPFTVQIQTYHKWGFHWILVITVFHLIYYFVLWPTNAQLFHKLSHCYMFRHYRVILRELVTNTLPSYTSISNAAVGNTIQYNTCVTWQGIDYKLSEDDVIVSKHVAVW